MAQIGLLAGEVVVNPGNILKVVGKYAVEQSSLKALHIGAGGRRGGLGGGIGVAGLVGAGAIIGTATGIPHTTTVNEPRHGMKWVCSTDSHGNTHCVLERI